MSGEIGKERLLRIHNKKKLTIAIIIIIAQTEAPSCRTSLCRDNSQFLGVQKGKHE